MPHPELALVRQRYQYACGYCGVTETTVGGELEEGFLDDIRFSIQEKGPREIRLFAADETSILLTVEQAEQLALALLQAADKSRQTPW
jgi:hypothetical protein